MSVLKVGANSVPPTAAGTTAPATTDKRTTRIANGILRFFKATESGPIRQSVTVGFGVGVFFLGIGGVFGALVGFIHGIFASIKLHNQRVNEKKELFKALNPRVQQSLNNKGFLINQAITLLSEIDKFHDEYNELCIFNDDEMDAQIYSLKNSILQHIVTDLAPQTASKLIDALKELKAANPLDNKHIDLLQNSIILSMQNQAITELNVLKDKIAPLTKAYKQGSTPELLAQALELKKSIKAINNKYEAFRTNEFKIVVSRLSKALKPFIDHGNTELTGLEEKVNLYIKNYDEILQAGPEPLIEEIKTFTSVYGEEQVGKLIDRLIPYTVAGQHMNTNLSKELSMATQDREATDLLLKDL
jgi:hypothetical protein